MTARRPGDWPADVAPLSIEEFENLGINPANELFWQGRRLQTRRRLSLSFPQSVLAVLAAAASIASVATGLNNAAVFLCARNIQWLSCPVSVPHL